MQTISRASKNSIIRYSSVTALCCYSSTYQTSVAAFSPNLLDWLKLEYQWDNYSITWWSIEKSSLQLVLTTTDLYQTNTKRPASVIHVICIIVYCIMYMYMSYTYVYTYMYMYRNKYAWHDIDVSKYSSYEM